MQQILALIISIIRNSTKIIQIYFLQLLLIVLLIACINFMNLSTARSAERAREVGVRKSIGAYRWQLSLQFISESVILSLLHWYLRLFSFTFFAFCKSI